MLSWWSPREPNVDGVDMFSTPSRANLDSIDTASMVRVCFSALCAPTRDVTPSEGGTRGGLVLHFVLHFAPGLAFHSAFGMFFLLSPFARPATEVQQECNIEISTLNPHAH